MMEAVRVKKNETVTLIQNKLYSSRPWAVWQETKATCINRLYFVAVFVLKATLITVAIGVFFGKDSTHLFLQCVGFLGTLTLFATLLYWSFYMWYLPQLHHSLPTYFDFRECLNHTLGGPRATVNLLNTQWHYGPDLELPPYDLSRLLTGGHYALKEIYHQFDVEQTLTLVETQASHTTSSWSCTTRTARSTGTWAW